MARQQRPAQLRDLAHQCGEPARHPRTPEQLLHRRPHDLVPYHRVVYEARAAFARDLPSEQRVLPHPQAAPERAGPETQQRARVLEPAGLLERGTPVQHVARRVQPVLARHPQTPFEQPDGPDRLGAALHHVDPVGQRRDGALEPRRLRNAVAVGECQDRPASRGNASPSRLDRADAVGSHDARGQPVGGEPDGLVARSVERAVVHDDDFEISVGLRPQRAQAGRQHLAAIADGDDHRDAGFRAHALRTAHTHANSEPRPFVLRTSMPPRSTARVMRGSETRLPRNWAALRL